MTPEVRPFPHADAVLAAQSAMLPQPDQLCGPVAGRAALHAVLEPTRVPSLMALARSSLTAVWPEDVPEWRPAGVAANTETWRDLPRAHLPDHSGTTAAGLAHALSEAGVAVTPVPAMPEDDLVALLAGVAGATYPIGVVANLRTGPVLPRGTAIWDVGHFVVLWGVTDDGRVAVADSYAELGAVGLPPGCRLVTTAALAEALALPPGRGLLLLCRTGDLSLLDELVAGLGVRGDWWDDV